MRTKSKTIQPVLGTMTFGPQVDESGARAMVAALRDAGYAELDTAYVYNDGMTEKMLGSILNEPANRALRIATKVHPRISGRLDAEAVQMQLEESLRRLQKDCVDILYFHFPDPVTPIDSALEMVAKYQQAGKVREFGLSNFPAWMVVDIWHRCRESGWPVPTVYQGLYNGCSRTIEPELIPALRALKMRLYVFNPLAGGMLTGKHTDVRATPAPGRFSQRASYRKRYWKDSYFDAVQVLTQECREAGLELAAAALRWLIWHSELDGGAGDKIILGASCLQHLDQNLAAFAQGQIHERVVASFDAAWAVAKPDSPTYFQFTAATSIK